LDAKDRQRRLNLVLTILAAVLATIVVAGLVAVLFLELGGAD
jgi:hypothetical protein